MIIAIVSIIVLACIFLMLIVLAQDPKSGGFAAGIAGGSQVMGVKKTTDLLENLTWAFAAVLIVCSIGTTFLIDRGEGGDTGINSVNIDKARQAAPAPAAAPAAGTTDSAK